MSKTSVTNQSKDMVSDFDVFTKDQVGSIILDHPAREIELFRSHFNKDIKTTIDTWHRLYNFLARSVLRWDEVERARAVATFLNAAAVSLLDALFLHVRGFTGPAGNLMRQYGEATAMALLCADKSTGVLERYLSDRKNYPYRKALQRVEESSTSAALRKSLGLDVKAWGLFKDITKFYDRHSHVSVVTLGLRLRIGKESGVVVGPDYDPSKFKVYRVEFRRVRSATEVFFVLIKAIDSHMPKKPSA